MRIRPPSPRRPALWLVLAAAMAMSAGAAVASPDDSEPLMKLLADKGLFAPPSPRARVQPAAADATPPMPQRPSRA